MNNNSVVEEIEVLRTSFHELSPSYLKCRNIIETKFRFKANNENILTFYLYKELTESDRIQSEKWVKADTSI